MKFTIKAFFSKYDQICRRLRCFAQFELRPATDSVNNIFSKWDKRTLVGNLGAVNMKIVFPLFSRLTGKKILFPRVHIRNISPPGRDLLWRDVRWENFERSRCSKRLTYYAILFCTCFKGKNCLTQPGKCVHMRKYFPA